jgi:hypothetical protein
MENDFIERLIADTPALAKKSLVAKILKSISDKDIDRAIKHLHFYNSLFPDELMDTIVIEQFVEKAPWIYFSRAPSSEYLQQGIRFFKSKICYFLADEFSKTNKSLSYNDALNNVDRIISKLIMAIKGKISTPAVALQDFHFKEGELQPGSFSALVISCFMITTHAFQLNLHPKDNVNFKISIGKAFDYYKRQGVVDENDLVTVTNLIDQYLEHIDK